MKIKRGLGTERGRLGTFKGFGTVRARLDTFRGFGTERARLGTFRGFGTERARLGTFRSFGTGLLALPAVGHFLKNLKKVSLFYSKRAPSPSKTELYMMILKIMILTPASKSFQTHRKKCLHFFIPYLL